MCRRLTPSLSLSLPPTFLLSTEMYFVLEWIRWSFFILHAALASGVSSSKEIGREEEVEHLSHAEVNLLKWWDLVREEVENPRLPLLFFSPFLSLSLFPSCLPHGGGKILGAEQQLQDEVAMHKLRQWLYSSLTVWCADTTSCNHLSLLVFMSWIPAPTLLSFASQQCMWNV